MRIPYAVGSDLGKLAQAPLEAFTRNGRPTDHENRVIAADRSEHVRPRLAVESRCHGLSAAGNRAHDDQLADAIDTRQQLRQQSVQGWAGRAADGTVGNGVANALGRGDARQTQLAQVARERGLRYVPTTLVQEEPELFLTANRLVADQLENCRVPFPFVHPSSSI
jgi:hypothetical protein